MLPELPEQSIQQLQLLSNEHLDLIQNILRNQKYINVYSYLKTHKEVGAVNVLDSLIILLEKAKKRTWPIDRIAGKQIKNKNIDENVFDMNDPKLVWLMKKWKDNAIVKK